jgi:hypothetical protein
VEGDCAAHFKQGVHRADGGTCGRVPRDRASQAAHAAGRRGPTDARRSHQAPGSGTTAQFDARPEAASARRCAAAVSSERQPAARRHRCAGATRPRTPPARRTPWRRRPAMAQSSSDVHAASPMSDCTVDGWACAAATTAKYTCRNGEREGMHPVRPCAREGGNGSYAAVWLPPTVTPRPCRPVSLLLQAVRAAELSSTRAASSIRFGMSIKACVSVTRKRACAPFVRPTPQSDPWRHDRARIVS